ncbi:MAG: hypothetical protein HN856_07010 [Gammaproteobacteria bacterium]|jgi:hypothetical protein|nr:hypothetical protein [Gammaproteobacteria bacterium]
MLLRASGQNENKQYEVNSVTSDDLDSGVAHGPWLRALTQATIKGEWQELAELRVAAQEAMGHQQMLDVLTVAAAFNGITRVADATGIPLDHNTAQETGNLREQTGISRFEYEEKSVRYQFK